MIDSFRKQIKAFLALAFLLVVAACSQSNAEGPGTVPTATATSTSVTQAEATPAPTATAVASDRIHVDTSLTTVFYSVEGETTTEIFESISLSGPHSDTEKASGLTATLWGYSLETLSFPEGCLIGPMRISLDVRVILPRHLGRSSLPAEIASKWQTFSAAVAAHEQRHVDINFAGVEVIRGKMVELSAAESCEVLETKVETLWNQEQLEIQAAHDQFHADEEVRVAALRAPLQAKIDANHAQIRVLAAQIASLDAAIAENSQEVANVEAQLDALRGQIDVILAAYPEGQLPPDAFAQYDELREHFNSIALDFNDLVDLYNATIVQRNLVAGAHDALVAATNVLVDEFNWTR